MGRGFDSSRQRQLLNDTTPNVAREVSQRVPANSGRYPSGQRGQTVNLLAYAFGGSNPPLPTICSDDARTGRDVGGLSEKRGAALCGLSEKRGAPGRASELAIRAIEAAEKDICGNSSAVERQPSKLGVAGSNPVSRSIQQMGLISRAHVAQLAERVLGKDEVSGSNPDMGSRIWMRSAVIASGERR